MTRITQRQKEIFDAHYNAKINGNFDYPKGMAPEKAADILNALRDGKTIEALWNHCWGKASITSQIMSSVNSVEYFSKTGLTAARNEMKKLLSNANIS